MSRLGPLLWPALVVILLLPALFLSSYRLGLLALVAAYAIAALAQNLLAGYADIPSLGNVAFFATGAYTAGSLISLAHLPALPAMLLGVLAAGVLGLAVGLPALRISGMHLAIVTVALVFASQEVMGQWTAARGLGGISVTGPGWLLHDRAVYVMAVVLGVAAYLAVYNLLRSRTGRAILALSDNPYAAMAAGIDPMRYHLIAFVASGLLTGVAGVIYLYYAHTVTPGAFPLSLSLAFLTMMILGGSRSLIGSLLGALIIGLLPEALSLLPSTIAGIDVQSSVSALYAILLLVVLRVAPEGLWRLAASQTPRL